MRRSEAINAVRAGASITDTASQFGISRATLHRWLKAYDPAHPVASLRPKQRGPKAPRWGDDVILQVMGVIADHPKWWGKHRVTQALGERGTTLSEATMGRILVVARQRIAEERHQKAHRQQAERRREARVMTRRDERDSARHALWQERLEPAFAPGIQGEERLRRIAYALARKGWKMGVKDLTNELRDIADSYLAEFSKRDILLPSEKWLVDADRFVLDVKLGLRPGSDIDHKRVAALNHLRKNFAPAALPHARISISGSHQSDE